jgi:hypothetical protein
MFATAPASGSRSIAAFALSPPVYLVLNYWYRLQGQ